MSRLFQTLALTVAVTAMAHPIDAGAGQERRDRVVNARRRIGSAVIKGRVIDAQTGSGLARAWVRLNDASRGDAAALMTDDSGSFTFDHVPPGAFTLIVDKSTYVRVRYPEGRRLLRGSETLTVTDAQVSDGVLIRMYHGGAINGRVRDVRGDPIEFVHLQALRLPKPGGERLRSGNSVSSNDLGDYRIPHLEAGDYIVLARPQRDMFGTRDEGETGASQEPIPTFYPGVARIDQAVPIRVERGATVPAMDLVLVEGTVARVNGMLVDSIGQPLSNGVVSVRPITRDVAQTDFAGSGTTTRPDGTFTLRLSPGEYEIEARATKRRDIRGASSFEDVGFATLNVVGEMVGTTIQLGPAARISGRVRFEGSSPVPSVEDVNAGVTIELSPTLGQGCRSAITSFSPDWTFVVDRVFGKCKVHSSSSIPGWSVKSLMHDGKDLIGQFITFVPRQQLGDVELVMTDRPTEMTLDVVDDRGLPTRDYVGLIFAVDKSMWTDTTGRYVRAFVPVVPRALRSDRVLPGRGDVVRAMSAGDYYVIAIDDLDEDEYRDPERLQQLSERARRVKLLEGVPVGINLRRLVLPFR